MSDLRSVTIYTDGAAIGNPGPGGYGVVLMFGQHRRELSGGFRKTTNNRMELLAAIEGLKALKGKCNVTLYSDSEYVVKGFTEGRAERWRTNGWRRDKGQKVVNSDLWRRLVRLVNDQEVEFQWVKGHAGIPENERADQRATETARLPNLPPDRQYESGNA